MKSYDPSGNGMFTEKDRTGPYVLESYSRKIKNITMGVPSISVVSVDPDLHTCSIFVECCMCLKQVFCLPKRVKQT